MDKVFNSLKKLRTGARNAGHLAALTDCVIVVARRDLEETKLNIGEMAQSTRQ
jgi:hypothetical protein